MRFQKIILSILIFHLFNIDAFSCSTIINENQAINRSNTRNQDGLGWCYSYVSSDLLSYRENKRISAIGFVKPGLYFDIAIPRLRSSGETVSKAIDVAKKRNRFCLEKDLPSSDYVLTQKNRVGNNTFLHAVLNDILSTYDKISDSLQTAKKQGKELTCVDQESKNKIAKIFPSATCLEIINSVKNSTKNMYLDRLLTSSCNPVAVKPFTRKSYSEEGGWFFDKVTISDHLDKALESKNIAGLTYNYAPLLNNNGTAMHASVVVGRKFNEKTRQCEYLVRNSHGRSCAASHPETRCDTSCNEDINKNCKRTNGYFWISERFLNHVGSSITVME